MKWKWTTHIKHQIKERNISTELVESALEYPDEIVHGKKGRTIYQKIIDDKLLRVITENNNIITAYLTEKIEKYMGRK